MEFLLYWLDEIDDVAGVCRHVATTAVAEAAALSTSMLAWGLALGFWLGLPQLGVNATLLAGGVTFLEFNRRHPLR